MLIPQLVAHRGYPEHYPENTLVGIHAAIRAGAPAVEVDVQLSADEIPVLLHDRTLQRVCGAKGTVHHLPFEQLRSLHPSEFERFGYRFAHVQVPSLAEFVQLLQGYPGVTAFIELKCASIEHFGPAMVLNRVLRELEPIAERAVLISFSFEFLLAARKQRVRALGAILEKWGQRKQATLREIKPEFLLCNTEILPRWGSLRVPNTRLVVYEVIDARLATQLARRGVELVETFAIGEMVDELELLRDAN
ncbi:MAG: glycerophosphodiester phosphodiesterase family protein [Acidiferrobacterales bacterium]